MENNQRVLNAGDIIFSEGQQSESMFDIISGRVGIYANHGTENETELIVLEAGAFFGEMGMIEKLPRSATAVAVAADTVLEEITESNFAVYFRNNPEKVLMIMKNMSQRLRGLTADYLEACRAITETVESEHIPEEKRGGLKAKFKKFIDIYNEGAKIIAESGVDVNAYYYNGLFL